MSMSHIYEEVDQREGNTPPSAFDDNPFTICVEGNISSGKTTVIRHLAAKFPNSVECIPEPIHQWQNFKGYNLLESQYSDPHSNRGLIQSYIMRSIFDTVSKSAAGKRLRIIERSIHSSRYIFLEFLRDTSLLSDLEYRLLDDQYQACINGDNAGRSRVDLIIYLRVPPHVAYNRMKRRNRREETNVSPSQLAYLHELYEKFLVREFYPLKCPVIQIPAGANIWS